MRASYILTPEDRHKICPSCLGLHIIRSFKGETICGRCQKQGITSTEFAIYEAARKARAR